MSEAQKFGKKRYESPEAQKLMTKALNERRAGNDEEVRKLVGQANAEEDRWQKEKKKHRGPSNRTERARFYKQTGGFDNGRGR